MSEQGSGYGGSVVPPPVHGASPVPLWGVPDSGGKIDADGYVWGSPDSRYGSGRMGSQTGGRSLLSPFASRVALGMSIALLAYCLLQLAGLTLLWFDAGREGPVFVEGMVVYGVASAALIAGLVGPRRLRVLFVAVAALAGAALPVYQARRLFESVGVYDLLLGQQMITSVLFPLIVGGGAVALLAKSSLSRR